MRLSKTAWLILGIGIFVIAFGSLFMGYSRQSGEQERLENSLSVAQAALPERIAEREDLESQLTQLESELTQATSSLNSSQAKFPEAVESIEYDEELFLSAHDCNLEIVSLTVEEPRDEEVEDVTYAVTTFEVEVRGKVADMLDFINIIATGGYFTTATVDSVDMKIPEPDKKEEPTAIIKLTIYSYEGE